ncbi:MAG: hypothetical protein ACI4Q3_06160, partial [Kiritimatiellia bacterium]
AGLDHQSRAVHGVARHGDMQFAWPLLRNVRNGRRPLLGCAACHGGVHLFGPVECLMVTIPTVPGQLRFRRRRNHCHETVAAFRDQWRRIVLMQTNREDCGDRYREIIIPMPPTSKWAREQSAAFKQYFSSVAMAKTEFIDSMRNSQFTMIASASGAPQLSEKENE